MIIIENAQRQQSSGEKTIMQKRSQAASSAFSAFLSFDRLLPKYSRLQAAGSVPPLTQSRKSYIIIENQIGRSNADAVANADTVANADAVALKSISAFMSTIMNYELKKLPIPFFWK